MPGHAPWLNGSRTTRPRKMQIDALHVLLRHFQVHCDCQATDLPPSQWLKQLCGTLRLLPTVKIFQPGEQIRSQVTELLLSYFQSSSEGQTRDQENPASKCMSDGYPILVALFATRVGSLTETLHEQALAHRGCSTRPT